LFGGSSFKKALAVWRRKAGALFVWNSTNLISFSVNQNKRGTFGLANGCASITDSNALPARFGVNFGRWWRRSSLRGSATRDVLLKFPRQRRQAACLFMVPPFISASVAVAN